jgi:3-oxoacyl-(acyl-carrier-protein) synthase
VLVDTAGGQIAMALGLRGPTYAVVSACATVSHAIGEGAELVRRGDADAVLAGRTAACIHPLLFAGVVMLEELGHARSRGAAIYPEVPGYGARACAVVFGESISFTGIACNRRGYKKHPSSCASRSSALWRQAAEAVATGFPTQ